MFTGYDFFAIYNTTPLIVVSLYFAPPHVKLVILQADDQPDWIGARRFAHVTPASYKPAHRHPHPSFDRPCDPSAPGQVRLVLHPSNKALAIITVSALLSAGVSIGVARRWGKCISRPGEFARG